MSIKYTDTTNYTNIANAIRVKTRSSNTYSPNEMATAISNIPSGSGDWVRPSAWPDVYALTDWQATGDSDILYLVCDNTGNTVQRLGLTVATVSSTSPLFTIERGHIENNSFVVDSTDTVSSTRYEFSYANQSGDYLLYRVKLSNVNNHFTKIDFSLKNISIPSYPSGCIEMVGRLPYYNAPCCNNSNLIHYDVAIGVNMSSQQSVAGLFSNCYSLKSVNMNRLGDNFPNLSNWFSYASGIEKITVGNISTGNVLTQYARYCYGLKELEIGNITTATNLSYAFADCPNLQKIKIGNIELATDPNNIVANDYLLKDIEIGNMPSATSMYAMFNSCRNVKKIKIGNVPLVTSIANAFQNCIALKELTIGDFSSATTVSNAFSKCYSLTDLYINGTTCGVSFTMADAPLTRESALRLFNALPTVSSTTTLTLNSTTKSSLSSADKSIATNKGWVIS